MKDSDPGEGRNASFEVGLLNDDRTPMEFVVRLLETVFEHSFEDATKIMFETHRQGKGILGVYPHARAVELVGQAAALAARWNWPLACVIAPVAARVMPCDTPPKIVLAPGDEIILIGPMGAGKSTQRQLLAKALDLPQCSMDAIRDGYYREIGFEEDKQQEIWEKEGPEGLCRYWKPFEAHAVERLLAEHEGCVIDFGAGHSVFEEDDLFERVRAALAPYPNVVLLLPTPDPEESIKILKARRCATPPEHLEVLEDLNAHFVKHHSNHDLAKIVVYTYGKTPAETCNEILAAITCKANP